MKFELIAGKHSNRNGNFKKGDIVTSDTDLESTFSNKFKRRAELEHGEENPRTRERVKVSGARPSDTELARREQAKNAKLPHPKPAKVVPAGRSTATLTTSRAAGRVGAKKEAANDPTKDSGKADGEVETFKSQLGEDVSGEFEGMSSEWAVLKNKKNQFFLVDRDKPNEPINEAPQNKTGIETLIKKLTS